MRAAPGAEFIWKPIETADSGLVGTLTVGIYLADTAVSAMSTAGINEIGTTGVYEATRTAPDDRGTYVLIASLDGTLDPEQLITDILEVTFSTGEPFDGETYATVDELFRVLKIRAPQTDEQIAAAERVLTAATGEIDSEIDLPDDEVVSGWQIALAAEVCLERAVEHWQQGGSPFGLIGLGAETGVAFAAKDSWARHAVKLAPLKRQWGIA